MQLSSQKQSPYYRLLIARDMAFAMIAISSQAAMDQNKDLNAYDSIAILRDCIVPRIQR